MHQMIKRLFGNRKSSSHSAANMNKELEALIKKSSVFTSDLGCRFRTLAQNAEQFLLHRADVTKCVEAGKSDQALALKAILDNPSGHLDETIVEFAMPLLLFRLVLDSLHACFSGKHTYGYVRAKLNEADDALTEAVSKASTVKELIKLLQRRLADKPEAQRAMNELSSVFTACSQQAKCRLNKFLKAAIKEMRKKFNKVTLKIVSLSDPF